MAERTVLVTGATGLLGCALVPALRAAGWRVVAHGHRAAADVQADLSVAAEARALLDRVAPDVIVHLAALTDVDACEREPQRAYRLNVLPVQTLAHWVRQSRPGCHLVHVSTDQVYDGPGPHTEDAVCITNTYAFSKIASEIAAGAVGATVLRTNFYGPSGLPGRRSFSDWLHVSLSTGTSIQVFDDVRFNPMAIDSLCGVIERAAQVRPAGVFNLGARDGTTGGMSKADFAYAYAAAAGLPTTTMRRSVSTALSTLAAYRPKDMRMDCTRIEASLGLTLPDLAAEIHRIGSLQRAQA
jgi:dTDP-4-dehydrorhamnose reductase